MSVKPKRHLAKAITWRIIASITTFLIGWIVTGNLNFGMTIGAADVIIKIALYYFHERIWYHSNFGIVKDGHHAGFKPIIKKKKESNEARIIIDTINNNQPASKNQYRVTSNK